MLQVDKKNIRTWSRLGLMGALSAIGLPGAKELHPNICLVSADVSGLDRFSMAYPEDYYNVGIAEQNMIGISAGLASCGKCVFATAYASFLTSRAHELVRQDLGYLQYNVKLLGFSAGVSAGTSGVAHWAIDDIALMRAIPGMIVLSPADAIEAIKMAYATADIQKPVYIRLCANKDVPIVYEEDYDYQIGKAVRLREGSDVAIIATGLMVKSSLVAAELTENESISCGVYNMHTIKPLDTELLEELYMKYQLIVTVEEHSVIGGLGGAVAEHKAQYGNAPRQLMLGINDQYLRTGTRPFVLNQYGLTPEGVAKSISNYMRKVSDQ